MRRLRRFALTAFVIDALLGLGVLLVAGEVTEAKVAPPAAVAYYPTEEGCAVLHEVAEGVWQYGGLTEAAACTGQDL